MIDAKVGQYYKVPCLRMQLWFCGEEFVPVLGPKHTDIELGVDWEHMHIDWRFASNRMFQASSLGITGSPHGRVISNDGPAFGPHGIRRDPVFRRRLCRRVMPDFPVLPKPPWAAMEAAQRQRCDKLKDGHTCPHRGIDLRPFARPDGTAICPGHGLHWDLRTGLLLDRHQRPNV